jgi:hypothetical protein
MKRHLDYRSLAQLMLAAFFTALIASTAAAAKTQWAFKPSYYTHDPDDGQRVAQYSPGEKAYAEIDNFRRSGYRQQRIRLQSPGGSADNIHMVETWGEGEFIRPYGEWLYPYRAGATPYGPWGNPQGPWTMPFESWVNPYGLGRMQNQSWPYWSNYGAAYPAQNPYPGPVPMPPAAPAYGGGSVYGGPAYGAPMPGGSMPGGTVPGGP